ncbi:hypothetical protein L6164_017534 [Bauhinia variegata]|uniref:Uncharacterized protein n=1 Tax=Bauhinia variegata TaxID=167791 RepID=A0ACB9N9R0_BAUVA|nr:hypothetical protein L6164_017534 [Bauhinia variegata]
MEAFSSKKLHSFLFIVLAYSSIISPAQATERPYQEASTQFIRTSCSTTTYPRLCFSSLAKHASFIQTNRVLLTGTSLNVSLDSAKATSFLMSTLSKRLGMKPREIAAMKDCVEEISESVDELRRSIDEMGHLRNSNFDVTMNDVQTWVSAALTDENTCADGFQGTNGNVKTTVRGRIVQVAQMTSNALALINQLASFHG